MQGANYQLDKEPLRQIPIAIPSDDIQEIIGKLVGIIILLNNTKIGQVILFRIHIYLQNSRP